MSAQFDCWKCGAKLVDVILPMSRREECSACHGDQHVCKMCLHHDNASRTSCLEDRAEYIADHERANFCDYFSPSSRAFSASAVQTQQLAKAKLAALFGDDDGQKCNASSTQTPAPDSDQHESPSDIAERKLRELLGG